MTLSKSSGVVKSQSSNSYRAELSSILAGLMVLQWAEQQNPSYSGGKVTFINDCQKAVQCVFHTGPIGLKDATQDEYDIMLAIWRIRMRIQTTIQPLWTTGHPTSVDNQGEQAQNAKAHQLSVGRSRKGGSDEIPLNLDISPSVVSILYKNTIVTSGLPQQILANLH